MLRWGAGFWVAACLATAGIPGGAEARETATPAAVVSLRQLPAAARDVHRAIRNGGPFASAKDGVIFANRERLLPGKPRGFYREYTVATPGVGGRGARRIVCGGMRPKAPDACYYTGDHYASFRRIAP
ncbi:MAG: ribonuclease domain-containing protein [Caldimonas sp.]